MIFSGLLARVQKSFRMKRMQRFAAAFPEAGLRILDVGGTPGIWRLLAGARSVIVLNMPRAEESRAAAAAGFRYVSGDGRRLPFRDACFDVVFSNSVIEHVGGAEAQQQFARETMRTGRGYWVQTPNRYFPIETHLLTPFVHFLPPAWRAFVARRFTVWQWLYRPDPEERRFYVEHFLSDIRLLSAGELRRLFPDGTILRERFLGFTKSLIAYRAMEE
jgi:hypothetical protein